MTHCLYLPRSKILRNIMRLPDTGLARLCITFIHNIIYAYTLFACGYCDTGTLGAVRYVLYETLPRRISIIKRIYVSSIVVNICPFVMPPRIVSFCCFFRRTYKQNKNSYNTSPSYYIGLGFLFYELKHVYII